MMVVRAEFSGHGRNSRAEPNTRNLLEASMANPSDVLFSTIVRAGRTTYFVDVREAKNGKKYLSISESRLDEDQKRQRSTLRVFGETVDQFRRAVEDAARAACQ
jgi:hypothetical protein